MSIWIAGTNSNQIWDIVKPRLQASPKDRELWESAYWAFYRLRIDTRYLAPIAVIQRNDNEMGEGFAITALFCSLVEFLETCEQGHIFEFGANNKKTPTTFKYGLGVGGKYFVDFLTTKKPFDGFFTTRKLAESFFEDVRCPLLHEARIQNGWRISTLASKGKLFEQKRKHKFLYRNELVPALELYFDDYRKRLRSTKTLQDAFIRKFDHLSTA